MPRRRISESDEVLASYLFAEEGRTQAEIAAELGVSAAVVSRVLTRVEKKYIERRICFLQENVPPNLRGDLDTRLLAEEISRELNRLAQFTIGRPGPKVRVFNVKPRP